MTPRQIGFVRAGYSTILNMRERFADEFFRELFRQDPSLRSLFKSGLHERADCLVRSLGALARNIDNSSRWHFVQSCEESDHVGRMLLDKHYFAVGAALMAALGECLGPTFTPVAEAAWAQAYSQHGQDMFSAFKHHGEAA
jgi:hemoglobin-like flavoprotein